MLKQGLLQNCYPYEKTIAKMLLILVIMNKIE